MQISSLSRPSEHWNLPFLLARIKNIVEITAAHLQRIARGETAAQRHHERQPRIVLQRRKPLKSVRQRQQGLILVLVEPRLDDVRSAAQRRPNSE